MTDLVTIRFLIEFFIASPTHKLTTLPELMHSPLQSAPL